MNAAGRPWKKLNNTKHLYYLFLGSVKKIKGIREEEFSGKPETHLFSRELYCRATHKGSSKIKQ